MRDAVAKTSGIRESKKGNPVFVTRVRRLQANKYDKRFMNIVSEAKRIQAEKEIAPVEASVV